MAIDYSTSKFNFTSGGEFTLTGTNFTGYFNIQDGDPFEDRLTQNKALVARPTIRTELYKSKYFRDRLIIDSFSFPFTLDDIQVAANEKVTKRTFNSIMSKLYENMLFLYSKLFIASNDIPVGYNAVGAVSSDSTDFRWFNQSDGLAFETRQLETVGLDELDGLNSMVVKQFDDETGYAIFGISNTYFVALSSDSDYTSLKVTLSSQKIAQNTEQQFKKLRHMSLRGDKLFIADAGSNTVYKYDVGGFFNGDRSIVNKRFLEEAIGGSITSRTAYSKNKFDNPLVVEASDKRVYVYDEGSSSVKIYDLNFVWRRTVQFPTSTTVIKDIKYNENNKYMYILTYDPKTTYNHIYVCDDDLNIIEDWILDESLQDASTAVLTDAGGRVFINKQLEEISRIEFSYQDSNIFYVTSNRSVFKKFVTRPDKTIGKWILSKYGIQWEHIWNFEFVEWNNDFIFWNELSGKSTANTHIDDLSIVAQPGNIDSIFLLTKTGVPSAFNLLHFDEFTIYDSILSQQNYEVFTESQLKVGGDEYVQGFVFNKEIYMIATNLLTLKNLLKGRFKGVYSDVDQNLVYSGYVYLTDEEIQNIIIDSIENLFIFENEIISPVQLNRVINKLYQFQLQMLNITQTKIIGQTSTTEVTGGNIAVID